jgi:transcriptional regulator with XRE-family HTH domain
MTKYKKNAYEEAKLFRQRGLTYTEIAKVCNISRSTVSNWFRHEPFSKIVAAQNQQRAVKENKKRLIVINKARQTERQRQTTDILRAAETEYKHYKHNPLFIAGLTVYLAEGDLVDEHLIRLSSARPELQQLCIKFLIDFLAVEKKYIRIWLLLYPDLDEIACMKYWSKKTGLSPTQFHKNQYVQGRGKKTTIHYGIANILVGSTPMKKKLLKWINILQKDLRK